MSAPIIVLPIERVERYRDRADAGYMNERPLDPSLASEIDAVLVKGLLGNAPFFQEGNWRFASIPNDSYNVALHYPNEIYEALSAPAAFDTARRMQAQEWASCLRNAVAHGGVLYLNRDGRPSHDQQAEVLAFVSAKYREDDLHHRAPPARLKVLQITEVGFASFLKGWVAWLRSCGLDRQLAA
jgi:hypothetical protein